MSQHEIRLTEGLWLEQIARIEAAFGITFEDKARNEWYGIINWMHEGRLERLTSQLLQQHEKWPRSGNLAAILIGLHKRLPFVAKTNGAVRPFDKEAPPSCTMCNDRGIVRVLVRYKDMPAGWPPYREATRCPCGAGNRRQFVSLSSAVSEYKRFRISGGRLWTGEPSLSPEPVFETERTGRANQVPYEEQRKEESDANSGNDNRCS